MELILTILIPAVLFGLINVLVGFGERRKPPTE